eukprot:366384-Chlamydomonas_euryale.AAC.18
MHPHSTSGPAPYLHLLADVVFRVVTVQQHHHRLASCYVLDALDGLVLKGVALAAMRGTEGGAGRWGCPHCTVWARWRHGALVEAELLPAVDVHTALNNVAA